MFMAAGLNGKVSLPFESTMLFTEAAEGHPWAGEIYAEKSPERIAAVGT